MSIFRSWCFAFCWQLPLPDLIAKNDLVSLFLILNRFKFMNGKKTPINLGKLSVQYVNCSPVGSLMKFKIKEKFLKFHIRKSVFNRAR